MNLEQYLIESKRTMIDMGKEKNLLHASLGLITELGELTDIYKRNIFYGKEIDLVNVKEELGDIMWYLAIIYREFNYSPSGVRYITNQGAVELIQDMLLTAINLNRLDKKVCNHLKDQIINFGKLHNFTFEEILETNINKLKKRFPNKFTEYHALNRDLEAEREVLEINK